MKEEMIGKCSHCGSDWSENCKCHDLRISDELSDEINDIIDRDDFYFVNIPKDKDNCERFGVCTYLHRKEATSNIPWSHRRAMCKLFDEELVENPDGDAYKCEACKNLNWEVK